MIYALSVGTQLFIFFLVFSETVPLSRAKIFLKQLSAQNTQRSPSSDFRALLEIIEFLDYLILCLESGDGLARAFFKAGNFMHPSELKNCVQKLEAEFELGLGFSQCLSKCQNSLSTHPFFKETLSTMLLSLRLGTPLSPVLESRSENLRDLFQNLAEGKAGQAPVKMLLPLCLLILPVLLLLLGGGIVRDVLKMLS